MGRVQASTAASNLVLSLTGLLFAPACSGPDPLPLEAPLAPPAATPVDSRTSPVADPTASPRFEAVFREVLVGAGCTSGYCHGSSGTLPMTTAETAYAWLVGVQSHGVDCSGQVRVVPGSPVDSLLWRKLAPGVSTCGRKMPYGRDPLPGSKLDLVRRWIEGGALP